MKNLVVADLLPAGFEITNPRLEVGVLSGIDFSNMAHPAHLEIRDDRLVLVFSVLNAGDYKFCYVVQAVTPGKYQHPPVTAECMYDAAIRGNSEGSSIEIVREEPGL